MKLRLDPNSLCFRLDFNEFEQLLEQGQIQNILYLPHNTVTYDVICLPFGSKATFKAKDGHFTLSLAREILEDHKESLPSLSGIINDFATEQGKNIEVSLEINLKKKRKYSSKA
ncbi:MAG: hypothetical protein K9G26_01985 [Emcibacter sp.]|nr:hypothetical protein [Emcibacter sp.]